MAEVPSEELPFPTENITSKSSLQPPTSLDSNSLQKRGSSLPLRSPSSLAHVVKSAVVNTVVKSNNLRLLRQETAQTSALFGFFLTIDWRLLLLCVVSVFFWAFPELHLFPAAQEMLLFFPNHPEVYGSRLTDYGLWVGVYDGDLNNDVYNGGGVAGKFILFGSRTLLLECGATLMACYLFYHGYEVMTKKKMLLIWFFSCSMTRLWSLISHRYGMCRGDSKGNIWMKKCFKDDYDQNHLRNTTHGTRSSDDRVPWVVLRRWFFHYVYLPYINGEDIYSLSLLQRTSDTTSSSRTISEILNTSEVSFVISQKDAKKTYLENFVVENARCGLKENSDYTWSSQSDLYADMFKLDVRGKVCEGYSFLAYWFFDNIFWLIVLGYENVMKSFHYGTNGKNNCAESNGMISKFLLVMRIGGHLAASISEFFFPELTALSRMLFMFVVVSSFAIAETKWVRTYALRSKKNSDYNSDLHSGMNQSLSISKNSRIVPEPAPVTNLVTEVSTNNLIPSDHIDSKTDINSIAENSQCHNDIAKFLSRSSRNSLIKRTSALTRNNHNVNNVVVKRSNETDRLPSPHADIAYIFAAFLAARLGTNFVIDQFLSVFPFNGLLGIICWVSWLGFCEFFMLFVWKRSFGDWSRAIMFWFPYGLSEEMVACMIILVLPPFGLQYWAVITVLPLLELYRDTLLHRNIHSYLQGKGCFSFGKSRLSSNDNLSTNSDSTSNKGSNNRLSNNSMTKKPELSESAKKIILQNHLKIREELKDLLPKESESEEKISHILSSVTMHHASDTELSIFFYNTQNILAEICGGCVILVLFILELLVIDLKVPIFFSSNNIDDMYYEHQEFNSDKLGNISALKTSSSTSSTKFDLSLIDKLVPKESGVPIRPFTGSVYMHEKRVLHLLSFLFFQFVEVCKGYLCMWGNRVLLYKSVRESFCEEARIAASVSAESRESDRDSEDKLIDVETSLALFDRKKVEIMASLVLLEKTRFQKCREYFMVSSFITIGITLSFCATLSSPRAE